ncbi:SufE family protein [Blastopirellula retiformator]|uniref:Cysteine desulfuration protein SufE n=1 Tax=Blastopirellula retiformator TaxID=2527970 RepID=A0A5C5V021_9BACT|nr:SufE family protein [Blastopirellula retiformator]TWT31986.1 Cysteine desulfuration protein SufE [Blastopirellula retiformator]
MSDIPTLTAAELVEEFEFYDDPMDRFQYLIELGRQMPPLDDVYKVEAYRVQGCQSQVWLIPQATEDGQQLYFLGDSDAQIVKGLAALLSMLLSYKTPDEILAYDLESLFEQVGLAQTITPSRANGFYNMVQQIRDLATAAKKSG